MAKPFSSILTRALTAVLLAFLVCGGPRAWAQTNRTPSGSSDGEVRALNDYYSVDENRKLEVPAKGVLTNDLGLKGEGLIALLNTDVAQGKLELEQDGSFVYTPAPGFSGVVRFTYQAKSGDRISNVAGVSIAVLRAGRPGAPTDLTQGLDLSIYAMEDDIPFEPGAGVGIVNDNANGQSAGYSLAEGQSKTPRFLLQLFNYGRVGDSFAVKGTASRKGWIVHYFDAIKEGNDITAAVTSAQGWATPKLEPGKYLNLRLEARVDPAVKATPSSLALVAARSLLDKSALDTVKAIFGFQRVAKIQYSLDQGAHWADAPSNVGDGAIIGKYQEMVGLRAIPFDPTLPWPMNPDMKPEWDNQGYWLLGEEIWIQCDHATGTLIPIQVECGNVIITNIKVVESYHVSIRPSQTYVPLNGGAAGSVNLIATVTNSKRQPVVGATVRFTANFQEGNKPAGIFAGSGPKHDRAVTDAKGVATIKLSSEDQPGDIAIMAYLLDGEADVEESVSQALVFGLIETEEPEKNELDW